MTYQEILERIDDISETILSLDGMLERLREKVEPLAVAEPKTDINF